MSNKLVSSTAGTMAKFSAVATIVAASQAAIGHTNQHDAMLNALREPIYAGGTSSSKTGTAHWEIRRATMDDQIAVLAADLARRQTRLSPEVENVLRAHRAELYE